MPPKNIAKGRAVAYEQKQQQKQEQEQQKQQQKQEKEEQKLLLTNSGAIPSGNMSRQPASAVLAQAPSRPALSVEARGILSDRWLGPVNVYADRKNSPFTNTLDLLREEYEDVSEVSDAPYSPSVGTLSSVDSDISVQIPPDELRDVLLFLPEEYLEHKRKSKKQKRISGNPAEHEQMLVFTNGNVASEDWEHLRELIESCPDIFGDEDTSSDYNPRLNPSDENPEEETVQDPEHDRDIIEASRELFGLLLGQLLSIEDEIQRYRWFKVAYERSKSSLEEVFKKLKFPECFESKGSKKMLVDVLGKLVQEGREFDTTGKRIEPTRNRKINQAFLDSKSSTATTIRFETKEEFAIFILSIYADSIHDANRIEEKELKTKVVKLKKACARNLVAKMYPSPQPTPSNVNELLQIIDESHNSTFETKLMNHFAKISQCKEVQPFNLATSISESRGLIFTDNASMKNEVNKSNSVISIQTLLDAGASNRSDLCFFDPYNVRFIWESEPGAKENDGEYYEFLVTQTVTIPSSSTRMDCKYFALDNFKRLSWRTGRGHKHHKKAVIERLPLCTTHGDMDGCFVSIMLRHVAERVWQQAVKSVGEPDGLSALPLISLKWSGDSSMGIESVLGYKNMCGFFVHDETMRRRLPYIVSTDTAMLPGIAVSHAICNRYNEIVEKNNTGNPVTSDESYIVNNFIDGIEVRRALISNDRSAHGGVILLLGAMLKAKDEQVNPHCKSILVCSGDEMVNISEGQIIRTTNRNPVVESASFGLARAGTGAGGIVVESTDDESVAGSCFSQKSYVNALSFYLREPKQGREPDTQEMLSSPSVSPPRERNNPSPLKLFHPKQQEFITFLVKISDTTLQSITESILIPDREFENPNTLAQRLNAELVKANQIGVSEEQNKNNIKHMQAIIEEFNQKPSKGGGFFTRSHSHSRNRSRSRNHHHTRYTNKRKHRLNKKYTIKHRKSYRKHKNTIKRHNIEK